MPSLLTERPGSPGASCSDPGADPVCLYACEQGLLALVYGFDVVAFSPRHVERLGVHSFGYTLQGERLDGAGGGGHSSPPGVTFSFLTRR